MGASGHRFSALPFLTGLTLCVAGACGGAASTPLDRPAPPQQGDDETSAPVPEASSSSSGGGGRDATISDETGPGNDDNTDASDGASVEDVQSSPDDAGPDAGMCGVCTFGMRCCTVPGALSFGQCYSVLCGACCL